MSSFYFWLLILLALLLAVPLGKYMHKVYSGEKAFLHFLTPFEKRLLQLFGVASPQGMNRKQYLGCFLAINAIWLIWGLSFYFFRAVSFLTPPTTLLWSGRWHSTLLYPSLPAPICSTIPVRRVLPLFRRLWCSASCNL